MLVFKEQMIATDKEGYLLNSDEWSKELAHWEVVMFVREFYLEFNTSPAIRMLVKAMAKKLGEDKGNSIYLYKLFPKGPAKQATKIAGLPKPARCI
jgi:tRNA 2-thiouridine synthesizing protein E